MALLSSLKNRVFLASATVAVLSIVFALRFVTARVSREAEADLERGLRESANLVDHQHAARVETLTVMARLVADLPRLKAAVETRDAPTVQPLANEYRVQLGCDLLVVADATGRLLALVGAPPDAGARLASVGPGARETRGAEFVESGGRVLEVITVPIALGLDTPEILGLLTVGFALDRELAARYRAATGSEVAFVQGARVLASTLPESSLGDPDYVFLRRRLRGGGQDAAPELLVLRSRTERLQFLRTFRAGLAAAALVAVLVAVLLSYAVARTVTRPLAALTDSMRAMTATGDLTRRVARERPWDDEDARLLARTFENLTDALARFQREAFLRDRLAAVGRLSTVIAHEVRNPLMILKASVRVLRRSGVTSEEVNEAAADIEGEVARLNRVVEDVLDLARPIRVEPLPVDLRSLCQEAANAASPDGALPVGVEVAQDVPAEVTTDPERLRTVLVNLLTNAREAIGESGAAEGDGPPITLRLERAAAGVTLLVEDRGPGIAPEQLAHVFEPYFTTRRTGTGLGLALSRHIVDSLGGSISISPRPGGGTRVRVDLPLHPPAAASKPAQAVAS
jgi:signal transduction histidine kinase